jgi:hypothetical protein
MKRYIAFVLALLTLICSTAAFATADNDHDTRASNYFNNYGTVLTAKGGGKIKVTFSCSSVGIASELGVVNYSVQRKNSSGIWEDFYDWQSGQTGTNVSSYSFSRTINGTAGTTYRVRCTFMCTKNGSTENKSYTSGSKKAT